MEGTGIASVKPGQIRGNEWPRRYSTGKRKRAVVQMARRYSNPLFTTAAKIAYAVIKCKGYSERGVLFIFLAAPALTFYPATRLGCLSGD